MVCFWSYLEIRIAAENEEQRIPVGCLTTIMTYGTTFPSTLKKHFSSHSVALIEGEHAKCRRASLTYRQIEFGSKSLGERGEEDIAVSTSFMLPLQSFDLIKQNEMY